MNIVVLPGNHRSNAEWGKAIADGLKQFWPGITSLEYLHWKRKAEAEIEFDVELSHLKTKVERLHPQVVIAKSAGVALAAMAVEKGILKPRLSFLIGTPLKFDGASGAQLLELLAGIPGKIVFIQEESDPLCSFAMLRQGLLNLLGKNRSLVRVAGKEHRYDDYEVLLPLIMERISLSEDLSHDIVAPRPAERFIPLRELAAKPEPSIREVASPDPVAPPTRQLDLLDSFSPVRTAK